MAHHSFSPPLVFREMLSDWEASGATLIESDRLLLNPNVSERAGYLWNTAPLLTNDFEVTFSLRVTGAKDVSEVADDQSFAFWYVYENVSAGYNQTSLIKAESWLAGLKEAGMGFSGFKSKFQGFGALFSTTDAKKAPKAVVSGIWNDGDRDLVYGSGNDVPTATAKAIDFRNTMNAAQFRLRVTPTSIVGFLKQTASLSWNECFNLDRTSDPVKTGGYVGFTAWTGTKGKVTDNVVIEKFDMYNYDTTSIGEEMKDVSKDIEDTYREMLTDEHRHFTDQKLQTEHINRLIRMINQHVEASKPDDLQMYQDLEGLVNRMGQLDDNCKLLTKELEVVTGNASEPTQMKEQIIGLRKLFQSGSRNNAAVLDQVEKNVRAVGNTKREVTEKLETFTEALNLAEDVKSDVVSRGRRTTWMTIFLILIIAGVGYLIYGRMQNLERKHFL